MRTIKKPAASFRNILLVNLGGAGDLLLATPFFREARRIFSTAKISLLSMERSISILEENQHIDQFETISSLNYGELLRNPLPIMAKMVKLRSNKYDLLINMLPVASNGGALRMFGLVTAIGPKYSVGLDTGGRGFFFNFSIYEADYQQLNAIDNYLKLLGPFKGKTDIRQLELPLRKIDDEHVTSLLSDWHETSKIIGINPGAANPLRQWPIAKFTTVVNQLAEHFPEAKFVITGMKSEAILGETLSKNCSFDQGRIKNLAGKTNLLELSALLRKLTLYITNDTGAMHVAAAVDVPFVAIFGPGDFQRFRPFSPSGKIAFARNCQMLDCVPCIKTSCSHWQCMVNVSEDMVFDAALTLL